MVSPLTQDTSQRREEREGSGKVEATAQREGRKIAKEN
jgi:hypothetical protein